MFTYFLNGFITLDGQLFEFTKRLEHSAKFVVGDIFTLEETKFIVREVTWYLDTPDESFLEVEAIKTGGITREGLLELMPDVVDGLFPIDKPVTIP